MRMKIKKLRDGSLLYGLTIFNKVVYGLFCVVLLIGFFSVLDDGGFTPATIIPILLFIISLGGAGYREEWHFNPHKGEIIYKIGFLFWVKREVYSSDEVKRITITHFVRGNPRRDPQAKGRGRNRHKVVFSLQFHDASTKDIEIIGERASGGMTEGAALTIASVMKIAYWQDRQRER